MRNVMIKMADYRDNNMHLAPGNFDYQLPLIVLIYFPEPVESGHGNDSFSLKDVFCCF